ncbi:SCO3242 family prenyltransferase [Streptomyces sp. NPDC001889]
MTTLLGRLGTPRPRPLAPPSAAPRRDRPRSRSRLRAWAELLRVSATLTVPGDTLTGAATLGLRPNRGTALALGASLCLYEAGMALNDWADRAEDTAERPHRPIPSGRITPTAALTAATALTAAGLTLASRAGRPALTLATALAATVWAYDLHLKHTRAGPAAMATARTLDLLLGATATATATTAHRTAPAPTTPPTTTATPLPAPARHPALTAATTALPAALTLGTHTYATTALSRHETHGGSTSAPLTALATTLTLATHTTLRPHPTGPPQPAHRLLRTALATTYTRTTATPSLHAALNPSPPLTQRAVGAGIRAMIPLQATLAARNHTTTGTLTALTLMGLAPLARALSRKVSPT